MTPASEVRALRRAVKHLRFSLRRVLRDYFPLTEGHRRIKLQAMNVLENTRKVKR